MDTYNLRIEQINEKLSKIEIERQALMKERRQIKKNLFRDEWRKKKSIK